ncbi:MAG: hypothetical protein ACRDGV_02215, partial [Candidatus Limnocylindria bacterium]
VLEPAPLAAELEPEPVVAEPELVAAVEDARVSAEAKAEPGPVEAGPVVDSEAEAPRRIRPISETILRIPSPPAPPFEADEPAAAQADETELAARRLQLDELGLGDPGQGPVTPERRRVLPYRSRGTAASAAELAARTAAAGTSFWEASAREVAGAGGHVGVQNCGHCGLSLSASARFCRRCGTQQARSA